MSNIKSKYVKLDNTVDGVNGQKIPANFTPSTYTPTQVASEGTDKLSAHLKGIDAIIGSGSGGGGSKNFYPNGDADEHTDNSNFILGNNVTFDNGGVLVGSFSAIDTTPANILDGTQVALYTQHASNNSLNDFISSKADEILIPKAYRGQTLGITKLYKSNHNDGDLALQIKNETSGLLIDNGSNLLDKADFFVGGGSAELVTSFHCPEDCEKIKIGIQVLVRNDGKKIAWDESTVTPDPFIFRNVIEKINPVRCTTTASQSFPNNAETIVDFESVTLDKDGLITTGSGWKYTAKKDAAVKISVFLYFNDFAPNSDMILKLFKNNAEVSRLDSKSTKAWSTANDHVTIGGSDVIDLVVGDFIQVKAFQATGVSQSLHGNSGLSHIDIIPVEVKETETVVNALENVPPVKYNTSSAQAISNAINTVVNFNTKIYDENNLVSIGGSWVYTAAKSGKYNIKGAVSLAAPTAIIEQCKILLLVSGSPKGQLKTQKPPTSGPEDISLSFDFDVEMDKNQTLQILVRHNRGATVSLNNTDFMNYIEIKKIDQNAILGQFPLPLVGYVKDVKASSHGGSSSANTVHTRVLQTVDEDLNLFGELISNQVKLIPGKYNIEAEAAINRISGNVLFWYNVTDATYDIQGIFAFADPSTGSTYSRITGTITITEPKFFELRHWIEVARGTDGLGSQQSSKTNFPGSNDVYAQVKITKVR